MRHTVLLHALLYVSCISQTSARVLARTTSNHPNATGLVVSIKESAPNDAMPLVSTHLSFSIEQDRWPDWSGVESRNEFTYNALVNLKHLTGKPPKIRVGANSEDRTVWSPTVTIIESSFPPPSAITPYPEATHDAVGDGFYQLSQWMMPDTSMTWGLNFGLDSVTNAINMAKSIVKAFSSSAVKAAGVHLDLIELGNEADLYRNNGLRPKNWTVEEYTADWINMMGSVVDALGMTKDSSYSIQGASFAGQGFTISEILSLGILQSQPGKLISQFSQHRYSGAFCFGGDFALSSFMSKAAVRSNITVFTNDISEVRGMGYPYIFGETGSIACHGAPGVSNTAGAALWVIDYTLQAATRGISETFFHEGIGFKYNFFQPVPLNRSITDGTPLNPPEPPHVQASYYAAILVARAIGKTGQASIAELSVADDNVSGYAIYEHKRIVRAVFINLHAWLLSSTGVRPSIHLALDFATARKASVRRLTIQHADDVSNLTLGGQSYETPDAQVSGKEQLETIMVSDGVEVAATEAVLLTFE